jgi:transcriptional regulator with XRE-family HTH domain
MTPTFPAALRAACLEAGLSQRQLGDAIGVGQPAISLIETGTNAPTLRHFTAMVHALDLDATGMLTVAANSHPTQERGSF